MGRDSVISAETGPPDGVLVLPKSDMLKTGTLLSVSGPTTVPSSDRNRRSNGTPCGVPRTGKRPRPERRLAEDGFGLGEQRSWEIGFQCLFQCLLVDNVNDMNLESPRCYATKAFFRNSAAGQTFLWQIRLPSLFVVQLQMQTRSDPPGQPGLVPTATWPRFCCTKVLTNFKRFAR